MGCSNSKSTTNVASTPQPKQTPPAKSKTTADPSAPKIKASAKLCDLVKNNKPILGYWEIKGRAYPARLLLAYAGVDFEDREYQQTHKQIWFETDKPMVGKMADINYPSIPYVIDPTQKRADGKPTIVFQSLAVQRYLGRSYDLSAKTDNELMLEDMFEGILKDLMDGLGKAFFSGSDEAMKKWIDGLEAAVEPIDAHLSSSKYLCGDNVTCFDFVLLSHMEMIENVKKDAFEKCKAMQRFRDDLMANDKLKKYVESKKEQPFFP